jgi:murein DD-endopeptidase MepM/ murein hydrolase activator NlpD
VASKHQELQGAQTELDTVRWRMSAVELQLEGVDRLSREVRQELGLPEGEGTWGDAAAQETPQGGPGAELDVGYRVELAQRRLAIGLRELELLADTARARVAPASEPVALAAELRAPAGWPVSGELTSDFGWRIFRRRPEYHTGVDISVPNGTPVRASADGTVVGSGWQPSYGWVVLVQDPGGYHTLYAHLSERRVRNRDAVAAGDIVGLSGSSGRSTGPHLHYEIWKDGRLQDPAVFMSPP